MYFMHARLISMQKYVISDTGAFKSNMTCGATAEQSLEDPGSRFISRAKLKAPYNFSLFGHFFQHSKFKIDGIIFTAALNSPQQLKVPDVGLKRIVHFFLFGTFGVLNLFCGG